MNEAIDNIDRGYLPNGKILLYAKRDNFHGFVIVGAIYPQEFNREALDISHEANRSILEHNGFLSEDEIRKYIHDGCTECCVSTERVVIVYQSRQEERTKFPDSYLNL